jgi:hypothetical protein
MSTSATATLRVSLCALALVAVAACGPAAGPTATAAPATPAGPSAPPVVGELGPGCDLLTDAQLTELASLTIERERERETNENLASCEWRGTHATDGAGAVNIRVWASGGPATLDDESNRFIRTFGTFPPYSGLGDRGAFAHGGGLYVVVGDRLIFVEARFGGEANEEVQEALVGAIIDALP